MKLRALIVRAVGFIVLYPVIYAVLPLSDGLLVRGVSVSLIIVVLLLDGDIS